MEYFDHTPYSPDLASNDFQLFPQLRVLLDGQRFVNDDEVKSAVNDWFKEMDAEWYGSGIRKSFSRY